MAGQKKRYVVALKSPAVSDFDWRGWVAKVPGVSLVGAMGRRAQIDAEPEAIQRLASEMGQEVLIEEAMERYIPER